MKCLDVVKEDMEVGAREDEVFGRRTCMWWR